MAIDTAATAPPRPGPDDGEAPQYVLRLCVTGSTPRSARAIVNIRKLCEEHLKDCYELEVVDISARPAVAVEEQVVAAPTLIKKLPLPLRRFIGDMSQTQRILLGLGVPVPTVPASSSG
jgi:circadian clock protein KaiB